MVLKTEGQGHKIPRTTYKCLEINIRQYASNRDRKGTSNLKHRQTIRESRGTSMYIEYEIRKRTEPSSRRIRGIANEKKEVGKQVEM